MPRTITLFPPPKLIPGRTAVSTPDDTPRPLVDQSVLDRLREELAEDGGYTRVFVGNFIGYLPHRMNRLRLALTTGDLEGAVDAILSLKTSSQMVGAERLAEMSLDLECEIRNGVRKADVAVVLPQLAATYLRAIDHCGQQTVHRLEAQWPPGAKR